MLLLYCALCYLILFICSRSKDQDGKSNIWSIEPKMEVQEEEDGGNDLKKNAFIGGALIATAVACLPLFKVFSSLLPDPADF